MIRDIGEGVRKEPNVCTDVDGNPAARYQFGKDREFRLTRACLLRNATPVENRCGINIASRSAKDSVINSLWRMLLLF